MIGVYHGEHTHTHAQAKTALFPHVYPAFLAISLHGDISHLIQLKLLNNLIGNNCLEKLNYINKTILTDYV